MIQKLEKLRKILTQYVLTALHLLFIKSKKPLVQYINYSQTVKILWKNPSYGK
jgi:hypothetical protein